VEGILAWGCKADSLCEASCDATILAQAAFDDPRVDLEITEPIEPGAAATLVAVLKVRLGAVLAVEARSSAVVEALRALGRNPDDDLFEGVESACVSHATAALDGAVSDAGAVVAATSRLLEGLRDPK
jgi:hypothetical protein